MTAASAASPFGGADKLSKLAWGTLFVLCGALFLDALDISMMGVALPSIRADLNMSTSSLQWVVSAYVLGYGGFLLLGGRAADLLGRRRVFVVALAVFVVASMLGGLANDGTLLIAARFIKGVSAAFTARARRTRNLPHVSRHRLGPHRDDRRRRQAASRSPRAVTPSELDLDNRRATTELAERYARGGELGARPAATDTYRYGHQEGADRDAPSPAA